MRLSIFQNKLTPSLVIISGIALTFTLFQNCSKTQLGNPENASSNNGQNQISTIPLEGSPLIDVINASEIQCASGGKVYSVYNDINQNFRLDEEDLVISIQVVCNGVSGSDGSSSLISMNRVIVSSDACESLAGVQLSSGLDSNKNKSLDASEISHTEVVCDGANGQHGAAGPAGSNGHSVVFSIASAPKSMCANGGSIIMMALDTENKGVYSIELPNQQSATICNGSNGMAAEASPYQIVSMIKPCGDTVTNKEVLLRLHNGQLLASVSDSVSGYNTRLAIVADGNYINTDPSACSFSISTQNLIRSISWQGAVRQTWPMPQ